MLGARDEILALAALLRTTPRPSPRALALCRRLVIDGESPLLHPAAAGTLRGAIREATLALDRGPDT